ncbi:putative Polypyrimidine tract-binding protein [Blattamonas nauphoetae]|uniref:Polypyrimidine tract-binding protein n=1 Tax=Blattamonas nauphoetae TaxID=2049346 RepID=A0ABQ9XER7_9EUKA|nr:putative Polypyrimidine tract-binding protein [Blattamonas nauphoetae]
MQKGQHQRRSKAKRNQISLPNRSVLLRSVPLTTTESFLRHVTEPFGTVVELKQLDKPSNWIITFETLHSSTQFIRKYQGTGVPLGLVHCTVEFATVRPTDIPVPSVQTNPHPARILHLTISNVRHDINVQVLCNIFNKYEPQPRKNVEKVIVFQKLDEVQALIQFSNPDSAQNAKQDIHGRHLFENSCLVMIEDSRMTDLRVHENSFKSWDFTKPTLAQSFPAHLATAAGSEPIEMLPGLSAHTSRFSPVLRVTGFSLDNIGVPELFNLFSCYGRIMCIKLSENDHPLAQIEYSTIEEAQRGMTSLKDVELFGHALDVLMDRSLTVEESPPDDQSVVEHTHFTILENRISSTSASGHRTLSTPESDKASDGIATIYAERQNWSVFADSHAEQELNLTLLSMEYNNGILSIDILLPNDIQILADMKPSFLTKESSQEGSPESLNSRILFQYEVSYPCEHVALRHLDPPSDTFDVITVSFPYEFFNNLTDPKPILFIYPRTFWRRNEAELFTNEALIFILPNFTQLGYNPPSDLETKTEYNQTLPTHRLVKTDANLTKFMQDSIPSITSHSSQRNQEARNTHETTIIRDGDIFSISSSESLQSIIKPPKFSNNGSNVWASFWVTFETTHDWSISLKYKGQSYSKFIVDSQSFYWNTNTSIELSKNHTTSWTQASINPYTEAISGIGDHFSPSVDRAGQFITGSHCPDTIQPSTVSECRHYSRVFGSDMDDACLAANTTIKLVSKEDTNHSITFTPTNNTQFPFLKHYQGSGYHTLLTWNLAPLDEEKQLTNLTSKWNIYFSSLLYYPFHTTRNTQFNHHLSASATKNDVPTNTEVIPLTSSPTIEQGTWFYLPFEEDPIYSHNEHVRIPPFSSWKSRKPKNPFLPIVDFWKSTADIVYSNVFDEIIEFGPLVSDTITHAEPHTGLPELFISDEMEFHFIDSDPQSAEISSNLTSVHPSLSTSFEIRVPVEEHELIVPQFDCEEGNEVSLTVSPIDGNETHSVVSVVVAPLLLFPEATAEVKISQKTTKTTNLGQNCQSTQQNPISEFSETVTLTKENGWTKDFAVLTKQLEFGSLDDTHIINATLTFVCPSMFETCSLSSSPFAASLSVPIILPIPPDPVDPSKPTDPTDPSKPTDPTDPSKPIDPTDPSTPIDPIDPSTPVDPIDPHKPLAPQTKTVTIILVVSLVSFVGVIVFVVVLVLFFAAYRRRKRQDLLEEEEEENETEMEIEDSEPLLGNKNFKITQDGSGCFLAQQIPTVVQPRCEQDEAAIVDDFTNLKILKAIACQEDFDFSFGIFPYSAYALLHSPTSHHKNADLREKLRQPETLVRVLCGLRVLHEKFGDEESLKMFSPHSILLSEDGRVFLRVMTQPKKCPYNNENGAKDKNPSESDKPAPPNPIHAYSDFTPNDTSPHDHSSSSSYRVMRWLAPEADCSAVSSPLVSLPSLSSPTQPSDTSLLSNQSSASTPSLLSFSENSDTSSSSSLCEEMCVFSFGLVLYEILTGFEPFSELDSSTAHTRLADGQRPNLDKLRQDNDELAEVIEKCWHPEKENRMKLSEVLERLVEIGLTSFEEEEDDDESDTDSENNSQPPKLESETEHNNQVENPLQAKSDRGEELCWWDDTLLSSRQPTPTSSLSNCTSKPCSGIQLAVDEMTAALTNQGWNKTAWDCLNHHQSTDHTQKEQESSLPLAISVPLPTLPHSRFVDADIASLSSFECDSGGTILLPLPSLSESGQQLPSSLVTFDTFTFIRIRNAKFVDQHGKTVSLTQVVEEAESQKCEKKAERAQRYKLADDADDQIDDADGRDCVWPINSKQFQIEAFAERMTIGSHAAVPRGVRAEKTTVLTDDGDTVLIQFGVESVHAACADDIQPHTQFEDDIRQMGETHERSDSLRSSLRSYVARRTEFIPSSLREQLVDSLFSKISTPTIRQSIVSHVAPATDLFKSPFDTDDVTFTYPTTTLSSTANVHSRTPLIRRDEEEEMDWVVKSRMAEEDEGFMEAPLSKTITNRSHPAAGLSDSPQTPNRRARVCRDTVVDEDDFSLVLDEVCITHILSKQC